MSLVLPSVKGSPLTCDEYQNNILYSLDLANATGSLDCSKISQSSLSTCLSANSVIIGINEDVSENATAIGEVSQDLTDAQTTLQSSINNLITLIGNQNTSIADLTNQLGTLTAAFNALDSTVQAFNSRLISVEGRITSVEEAIATGIIVVWSGLVSAIPTPYILCNGQNSTPDLRDRFIVGAGGVYGVNTVGGSTTHTHTLTGTTGGTSLTVNQMPAHDHTLNIAPHAHDALLFWSSGLGTDGGATDTFDRRDGRGAFAAEDQASGPIGGVNFQTGQERRAIRNTNGAGEQLIQNTIIGGTANSKGANEAHSHTFSSSTAATSNLPPYYALAFIMKV